MSSKVEHKMNRVGQKANKSQTNNMEYGLGICHILCLDKKGLARVTLTRLLQV